MTDRTHAYDLVVFGATGYVGKILCEYLAEHLGDREEVRWAIAGRNATKLAQLANALGHNAGRRLGQIVADATDEASLRALCAQTRVVISTVGPYALYGDLLVKSCAQTGTDYCDLTGEIQWIRRTIKQYEALARETGARIVHCCGFDSVPSDLGVYFLQQQARQRFGQPCSQVKMRVMGAQGGFSGGTVASGLQLVKEAAASPEIRQELSDLYSLCPETAGTSHPQPNGATARHDEIFGGWVGPFVMAPVNARIVLRSQALLDPAYGPAFEYEEAVWMGDGIAGWSAAWGMTLALGAFAAAAAVGPLRWALANTLVPAPGEGPTPEERERGFYHLRFWGRTPAGETLGVDLKGDRDPGYGSTAKILGQAGLSLACDFPKSAKPGGFWTPASLFGDVLIERLMAHAGLTFVAAEAICNPPDRN